jgi:hypothetical protein
MTTPDARAISLTDLPLLLRLSGSGTILDSELQLTQETQGASLSSILMGRPTIIARAQNQQALGQFRYKTDDLNAHITFVGPQLGEEDDDSALLHLLDGMAREAGKHGAHALIAEVEIDQPLYRSLRRARFAAYARQTLWRRGPLKVSACPPLALTEESSTDQIGITSLMNSTIPTLQQIAFMPHGEVEGLVWRKDGQVEAYLTYVEGKHGIYIVPFIHPDVMSEAEALLLNALARIPRTDRLPIAVCVRSYQTWLESRLAALGFEPLVEQAVMVRHIAAGIKEASFKQVRARSKLEIAANAQRWVKNVHLTWETED